MTTLDQLRARKKSLLDRIVSLPDMRRGSVTEQFFEARRQGGKAVRRGPYFLYTYKCKGKTVSRRLPGYRLVEQHRKQIDVFRRFEKLCAELVDTSQELCDLKQQPQDVAGEQALKKKRRSISMKRSTERSRR